MLVLTTRSPSSNKHYTFHLEPQYSLHACLSVIWSFSSYFIVILLLPTAKVVVWIETGTGRSDIIAPCIRHIDRFNRRLQIVVRETKLPICEKGQRDLTTLNYLLPRN
jgi:hypothetical protein